MSTNASAKLPCAASWREDARLVAGSSAHFENLFFACQLEQLDHSREDVGLGDPAVAVVGQRRVVEVRVRLEEQARDDIEQKSDIF